MFCYLGRMELCMEDCLSMFVLSSKRNAVETLDALERQGGLGNEDVGVSQPELRVCNSA